MEQPYEVLIIGGSYAGLSAALCLGRALRRVLVLDSGTPCNRFAPHSHNFLTHDGNAPGEVATTGREQIQAHYDTVEFVDARATDVAGQDGEFTITTDSGTSYRAQKLLFATGLADAYPDLPGFDACWGKSVIHCPYCHGYEYRGQPTAILMNSEHSGYMSRLIRNWTDELTLLTNGPAECDVAAVERCAVTVDERPLRRLVHQNGQLQQIEFAEGAPLTVAALYLHPHVSQQCPLPEQLGCALGEHGHLQIDDHFATTVTGVYAAGDCTTMFRSVANAVRGGNMAAAMINHALVDSHWAAAQ